MAQPRPSHRSQKSLPALRMLMRTFLGMPGATTCQSFQSPAPAQVHSSPLRRCLYSTTYSNVCHHRQDCLQGEES